MQTLPAEAHQPADHRGTAEQERSPEELQKDQPPEDREADQEEQHRPSCDLRDHSEQELPASVEHREAVPSEDPTELPEEEHIHQETEAAPFAAAVPADIQAVVAEGPGAAGAEHSHPEDLPEDPEASEAVHSPAEGRAAAGDPEDMLRADRAFRSEAGAAGTETCRLLLRAEGKLLDRPEPYRPGVE